MKHTGRGILKAFRNPGILMVHLSFVLVLVGALLTFALQERGIVGIAPGEEVTEFRDPEGRMRRLPVKLSLDSFRVEYYPGGMAPRDYVSHLLVDSKPATVSMNRVLTVEGFRLCQSGYGPDGSTVLSVSHDPWGTAVVYAGFLLFSVGGLWLLLSPRGKWRRILGKLGVVCVLMSPGVMSAAHVPGIPRSEADSLMGRQVVYQGRVVTFNTLSRDVVMKLHGSPSYRGLTPEQTLLSMRLYPEEWKSQPLLLVKDDRLRRSLGLTGKYASLQQLFDSAGNYKVGLLLGFGNEQERRAVEDLDEKVGIVLTLYSDRLIVNATEADGLMPDWRVRLELVYNAIPFSTIIFILLFCGASTAFLSLSGKRGFGFVASACIWLALATSVACFAFQWILAGRLPLSNTYETLQFSVLVLEVLVLSTRRQGVLLQGIGMLLAGALALTAHLVEENPVVTPLMPVLHSRWLSLHVSLVMTSYALFCLTFIAAVAGLVSRRSGARMRRLSLAALYPAEWLLGLGIITGSVWAATSWGRYWSWDPKETLALVTFVIYALPLHSSVRFLRPVRNYHLYMLFAILAVGMTWFGVNLFTSLHAYN